MIAANIGVIRLTLDNWCEKHPAFMNAMTHARELSLGWWEEQGLKGIWSKDFNANAYSLQVRNRFPDDWRDKQVSEHTGKDGGPIETTDRTPRDLAMQMLDMIRRGQKQAEG